MEEKKGNRKYDKQFKEEGIRLVTERGERSMKYLTSCPAFLHNLLKSELCGREAQYGMGISVMY